MADSRFTQAGLQAIVSKLGDFRFTQAGLQVLISTVGDSRHTQAGLQVLTRTDQPNRPIVQSITGITQLTALIAASAYVHPLDRPHSRSQWRIYEAIGGTLVYDTGPVADDLEQHLFSVPEGNPGVVREVEVRYRDDAGNWSAWSSRAQWQSTFDVPDSEGNFDRSIHSVVWCRNRGHPTWGYNLIGAMGAYGTILPEDVPGREHLVLLSGRAGQFGRFVAPPSALVRTGQPGSYGMRVNTSIQIWPTGGKWWPWYYYDCEGVRAGAAACASGTATKPGDVWTLFQQFQAAKPNTMSGVWARLRTGLMGPNYGECDTTLGRAPGYFELIVYDDGESHVLGSIAIPIVSLFQEIVTGREGLAAVSVSCFRFPWYTVILEVERDYDADPTGRTHLIRAAWERGYAVPEPRDGWDFEETWVGGAEESFPGAGDGGLPCGWGGFAGNRFTGATLANVRGFTLCHIQKVENIHEDLCVVTPEPPEEEPPPEQIPLSPQPLQPCPPEEPGTHLELHMGIRGGAGEVLQYGGDELDAGTPITGIIRPNVIAPSGFGGEAILKNVYVVLTHRGDLAISVVPVVNGELVESEEKFIFEVGTGQDRTIRRELPFTRPFPATAAEDAAVDERLRNALRGTTFTVELRVNDICGSGLELGGIELEVEGVRERHGAVARFTESLLGASSYTVPWAAYLGQKGAGKILLSSPNQNLDDGVAFTARAEGRKVWPAGIGGECIFTNLYLTHSRWNDADLVLQVTPIVDNVELPTETVTLPATTQPLEGAVTEVPLSRGYDPGSGEVIRTRPRGAAFTARIESGAPDEMFVMEGMEVEVEVVRETEPGVQNE